jgi:hypothetical protein
MPITRKADWASGSRLNPSYSPDPHHLAHIRAKLSNLRALSRNKRTVKGEYCHWSKWLKYCIKRKIDPWRDDLEDNSGRDRAGYQEEIDIASGFVEET